jgi:hypothetical protein
MEEKIFEIIAGCDYYSDPFSVVDNLMNTARDIDRLMKEFIEFFHERYGFQRYLQINEEPRKYITRIGSVYESIDEIFDYWYNNVYKK